MIREFKNSDREDLIVLLKKGFIFDTNEINKFFQDEDRKLMVYDEGGIWGFAYIKNTNIETKEFSVLIYVDPHWRRKGIGTALYNNACSFLKDFNPHLLTTYFKLTKEDFHGFYSKLGYKRWWGCHEAYYRGDKQPDVDLNFATYEDKYFDEYVKLIQDGFYELRRENDIKPYCCTFNDDYREHLLTNKDNIYVSLENGKIIATVAIKDGYLDNIVVASSEQGKGLGRKITQFAINTVLKKVPSELIHLTVVTWNKKALKLYEELGFKVVHTIYFYRQFCHKDF